MVVNKKLVERREKVMNCRLIMGKRVGAHWEVLVVLLSFLTLL